MWVTTQGGFYSAVQHNTDPSILVVRTRSYSDALTLAKFLVARNRKFYYNTVPADLIKTKSPSDYPWRLFVDRGHFADFVSFEVESIGYSNFKDQVKKVQGYERASTYSGVWSVMLEVEDKDPANPPRKSLAPVVQTLADAGFDAPDSFFDDDLATDDFAQVNKFLTRPIKKRERGRR
jgi:hypothetical protein